MKKYTIIHKLLSGDVTTHHETQAEIDQHELDNPLMYEPNCVTEVTDNSMVLKHINVRHKNKETLVETQSDFKSEYAQKKHEEQCPEMYEPTCEYQIRDLTGIVQKQTAVLSRTEVRKKCLLVLDLIAYYNEEAPVETMTAIFSNPSLIAITMALLTGAPKTAKAAILLNGSGLYSAEQVTEIVGQLDAIIASEGV